MKKILQLLILIVSVFSFAQNFNYLGDYTYDGTPLYLEPTSDVIDDATMQMVSNSLPEGYPVPDYNPHYISSGYDTDIVIEKPADVWVTFVDEGAGYRNVLGFYTYNINDPNPVMPTDQDITIIFPNVSAVGSGGGLQPGNKVKIGTFQPDTVIGWVLLANAWNGSLVTWGHWQLYSNTEFNPEADEHLRHHNVLLADPENDRVILGFEDIRRDYSSCDNDFNDAIFYVTANPYDAIKTTNLPEVVPESTTITSANLGGLESNGNLASKIAKRNFKRKIMGKVADKKILQKTYAKGKSGKNSGTNSLEKYLPETGMYGNETAYVSSPDDLLGITNAQEVFSVDLYQDSNRVSAVLATKTVGGVYDHSKAICDRLNSSSLEDIRTVTVRGHNVINSEIKRATGETEYTLSFSVKLEAESNKLFSFWNIDQYPEGDYNNFQIWGSSFSQVFAIANHIIDTFTSEKALTSTLVEDKIPSVFVKSGYYSNGKIHLNIINKTATTSLIFNGNVAETEVSNHSNIQQNIALSGAYNEVISVDTGVLFDIGFSLATNTSAQKDALYLADGPWGLDYLDEAANINTFLVDNEASNYSDNVYEVNRQPMVSGSVRDNVNLFRHILPGDQTLNVSEFTSVQFEIFNSQPVEIVLMPEELTDWNNRLRYTLPANSTETMHVINFSDFKDANGNSADITNIKTIVFSVLGNYSTLQPFTLSISELAFSSEASLSNTQVEEAEGLNTYPNPFTTKTTVQLKSNAQFVDIKVYDMLGRTVDTQHILTHGKAITYSAPNLSRGLYKFKLIDSNKRVYSGTFMKE
ncbi:hypothetical protein PK35_12125 [Tamlana nanhaiensis]|uniref:DUF4114 domain-containing protein n=1 Tax=Neotamlana nanhaiensis TaxID=1382798 RepID=A0A0D7VZY7_9FLAO|nr:DUF4114 domain-containing protein [Tamlana nanhaiensis]KJD32172.1 hypothetical protein PK35_11240 [Tamlana nanhaiensis]KJD32334.1 hypothetical protein PK35_12125 [Tamlana nanhaiensis]